MVKMCLAVMVVLVFSSMPTANGQFEYYREVIRYTVGEEKGEDPFETWDILDSEEQVKIWNNMNLQATERPIEPAPIRSFDVSSEGRLVVSLAGSVLQIYDSTGQFEYGYTINTDNHLYANWYNDHLAIYFSRGSLIVVVNVDGELIEMMETDHISDGTRALFRARLKEVNGILYEMSSGVGLLDFWGFTYPKLIKSTPDRVQTILYDASVTYWARTLLAISGVTFMIGALIADLVKRQKAIRLKSNIQNTSTSVQENSSSG